eukprot:4146798-Pleurochrysis_carterae.AAC.1
MACTVNTYYLKLRGEKLLDASRYCNVTVFYTDICKSQIAYNLEVGTECHVICCCASVHSRGAGYHIEAFIVFG